jgi:hypothetical protein
MRRFNALATAALALGGLELNSTPALAISGGSDAVGPNYGFVVKLDIGGVRSCTGALVRPLWVITAASCFEDGGKAATLGHPYVPTTAVVGRSDLTATSGEVVSVVQVVPTADRNVALVRLSRRVDRIAPVAIGTAPAPGEHLRVAGYGRTSSQWVPQRLQVAPVTVQAIGATSLSIDSDSSQALALGGTCRGDAGGPTLRERDGVIELVGITSSSWQRGCLGETETRSGGTQGRVDDLAGWIGGQESHHQQGVVAWTTAVSCYCWDRECWSGFCPGGACSAKLACELPSTKYDVKTGDFDADGRADVLTLSPNAMGDWGRWAALELSRGDRFDSRVWPIATAVHMRNGGPDAFYRTLEGDFDGNGSTDLATVSTDGGGGWGRWIALELSKNGAFDSQVWDAQTPISMRLGGPHAYIVRSGDFNGDGRTDLATISPDGEGGWADRIALELSRAGGGFDSQPWNAGTPVHMRNGGPNRYFVLSGDLNGDGRTDLATVSPNGGGGWSSAIAVEFAKAGGGFDSQVWDAGTPVHMRNGDPNSTFHVIAADFTGDGRTDIATISPNGGGGWADCVALEVARASGGFESQLWRAETPGKMRAGGATANYRVIAGDLNGDGKADLVTLGTTGGDGWASWLSVEVSTGTGFTHALWPTPTPGHIRNGDPFRDYRLLAGDFDGNDMTDLAVISPSGGGAWDAFISVDRSNGSAFESRFWSAVTPTHMRNGAR